LGAALFVWHQLLENPRVPQKPDAQWGSLLGPSYSNAEIEAVLREKQAVYHCHDREEELCAVTAGLIARSQIVGWVQGRMEFGPARARQSQHPWRCAQSHPAVGDEPENQVPRIVPAFCSHRAGLNAPKSTSICRLVPTVLTC